MSTQEAVVVTEPAPAPSVSKNKRKKAAAKPVVEPIQEEEQQLPELPDEQAFIPNPYVYIEEGFSGWTLAKGVFGGFALGSVFMGLLYGYARTQELKRQQQEFIVLQAQEEADRQTALSAAAKNREEQPSANA